MSERRFTVKQWRDAPFIFDEAAGEQVASGEQLPLSKAVELLNDVDATLRALLDEAAGALDELRERVEQGKAALGVEIDDLPTDELRRRIAGHNWPTVAACLKARAVLARIEGERGGGK